MLSILYYVFPTGHGKPNNFFCDEKIQRKAQLIIFVYFDQNARGNYDFQQWWMHSYRNIYERRNWCEMSMLEWLSRFARCHQANDVRHWLKPTECKPLSVPSKSIEWTIIKYEGERFVFIWVVIWCDEQSCSRWQCDSACVSTPTNAILVERFPCSQHQRTR